MAVIDLKIFYSITVGLFGNIYNFAHYNQPNIICYGL
jgi:hypothetical protein